MAAFKCRKMGVFDTTRREANEKILEKILIKKHIF